RGRRRGAPPRGSRGARRGRLGPQRRRRRGSRDRRLPDGLGRVARAGRGGAGPGGTLLGPTIAVADPESELARDELFGPLLTVVDEPDLDSALEFLNRSRYGNAGAIFTSSGEA